MEFTVEIFWQCKFKISCIAKLKQWLEQPLNPIFIFVAIEKLLLQLSPYNDTKLEKDLLSTCNTNLMNPI